MENAPLYSSANGMQRRDAEEVISEFCDKLKWTDDARILDIGCGTGEVTAAILLPQLPKDFRKIIGLDVSQDMIQYARKVHSHPKLTFVQFDIARETDDILEELNAKVNTFESNFDSEGGARRGSAVKGHIKILLNGLEMVRDRREMREDAFRIGTGYDIISSFYCLHWIHNQRLALRNIHRLLKPGGDALLVLLAKSPIFSLYDTLSKSPDWKEYMTDVENFISPYHRSEDPVNDFTDILDEIGFDAIKLECRERYYTFQSTANLRNAIIAVNPFVPRIPNNLRSRFISDCLEQIEVLQLAELANNCHKVTYKLLVAHVRKSP